MRTSCILEQRLIGTVSPGQSQSGHGLVCSASIKETVTIAGKSN